MNELRKMLGPNLMTIPSPYVIFWLKKSLLLAEKIVAFLDPRMHLEISQVM